MKFGFVGLGRMGLNMVLRQLEQGNQVVAWNRSEEPREQLRVESKNLKKGKENLAIASSLEELVSQLEPPKVVWLMVSAGQAVDDTLARLAPLLSTHDLIVDGGNSFHKDTLRRNKELDERGIHFMDVGTSGGVESARNGACLMIGGTKENFAWIEPILKAAAAPDAYGYFGPVGSGHFAKMIHNGIEYGMMEAIAEGAAILKNSEFNYDLREVFRVYNNRSIIESRLIGWTQAELQNDPQLANISSVIGSGGGAGKIKGEGHWTVQIARNAKIGVPVIEASLKVRENSDKDKEDSPNGFRNKVVAAMRWQFGRHPVKKKF